MRELAKEELNEAKASIPEMEDQLKILLLPKDENDDKNVIVEIRGGAGGDEAALFAAELYRMYCMYAESQKWKTEMISVNENGLGGFKEVVFMINGQGAYSRLKSHIHILSALLKYSSVSISEKNLQPLSTSFTDSSLTHHLNFPLWLNIFFETILPPASVIKVTTLFILFHPFQ